MVAHTADITGSYDSVFNESVAQIGCKFDFVEEKKTKRQAIQIEQISQSGMGAMNR